MRHPTLKLAAAQAVLGIPAAALLGAVVGSGCAGQWLCSPGFVAGVYALLYTIGVAASALAVLGLWGVARPRLRARLWVMGTGPPLIAVVVALLHTG